jgi:hypothetical protein
MRWDYEIAKYDAQEELAVDALGEFPNHKNYRSIARARRWYLWWWCSWKHE